MKPRSRSLQRREEGKEAFIECTVKLGFWRGQGIHLSQMVQKPALAPHGCLKTVHQTQEGKDC